MRTKVNCPNSVVNTRTFSKTFELAETRLNNKHRISPEHLSCQTTFSFSHSSSPSFSPSSPPSFSPSSSSPSPSSPPFSSPPFSGSPSSSSSLSPSSFLLLLPLLLSLLLLPLLFPVLLLLLLLLLFLLLPLDLMLFDKNILYHGFFTYFVHVLAWRAPLNSWMLILPLQQPPSPFTRAWDRHRECQ